MAATHWDESTYPKQNALDELSCRPDFAYSSTRHIWKTGHAGLAQSP
jgi:hypothetical protein